MTPTTALRFLMCFCTIFAALISANRNPPVITGPLEIKLKAGQSLNITCTGDTNINWTYPSFNQVPPISGRIVKTDSVESEKFISRLEISKLQYDDTGEFLCIYANQSRNNLTSVAAYVFVQDETHLFAALPKSMISVVHGEREVIPCRVTNPQINATLWKGSTMLSKSSELAYNPMTGFIVASITVFYSGSFTCRASMNGQNEEKGVFLYCLGNKIPYRPTITTAHSNSYLGDGDLINVMLNDNLALMCQVQITYSEIVRLEWAGVQTSDRINISAAVKQAIDGGFFRVWRNLTIDKIQNSDERIYACVVTSANRKSNKAEVNVLVFNHTNVNVSTPKKFVQIEDGAPQVFLSVDISSNSLVNLTWLRNTEVISPTHDRYKQSSRHGRALLKILKPVVSDAGPFTLWAMTKDMNASETITLAVSASL